VAGFVCASFPGPDETVKNRSTRPLIRHKPIMRDARVFFVNRTEDTIQPSDRG
jgi:hypothetical protein